MLRSYQEEAIASIFNYFNPALNSNMGNPVVAMPTGTGKSHVIAGFTEATFNQWPYQRFMILTHVKELIQQDYDKLTEAWPLAPAGIYSAGLKQKDLHFPITFGGVASVIKNVEAFGHIDILIIDEAHLLSPVEDSMYMEIIARLKKINPYLRVIGFTATKFRMGQGLLTDPFEPKDGGTPVRLFTDICFDITGIDAFNRLIREGFLAPLVPKRTRLELSVANVGISKGEYKQAELQRSVDKDEITYAALQEAITLGQHRQSWLVFASGVEHSEHVANALNALGIPASFVHSRIAPEDRDARIKMFKRGQLRALVNNNILTTGFDHPPIDFIVVLRPTLSVVLWVQMLGRGTRPWQTKDNCLVADFAANTRRLGPINDPMIPRPKSKGGGTAPVKSCEVCSTWNHLSVRFCTNCGSEFTFATKLGFEAATEELIRDDLPKIERFAVRRVVINRHQKPGSLPVMQVTYYCENSSKRFNEFIALEHSGFAKKRARDWWKLRHWSEPPETTDEALKHISQLRAPKAIMVHTNREYPEVTGYEWT